MIRFVSLSVALAITALVFVASCAGLPQATSTPMRASPPTPTPAPIPTLVPSPTPAPTASSTPTPAITPTPVPTATLMPTPTPELAPGPTLTPTPRDFVAAYGYRVVRVYPHDRQAFTQGLVFEDGFLYEGTGLRGRSTLRRVELETGRVLQEGKLADQFFGEGVTIFKDNIIQLTWQSNVGFVYNKDSFELLAQFSYPTEGWGITHDEGRLIMSDGTSILHFLDPESFSEIGSIQVYDDNGPVTRLNELEYVRGEIYANIWQTDSIARISPQTGRVLGLIDLKGLLNQGDPSDGADVLNGIAYDKNDDRLFVTGKLWPNVFELIVVPALPES